MTEIAPHLALPTASFGRRIAASLYEGTLLTAIVLMMGFLLAPIVSPTASTARLEIPQLAGRVVMLCGVFMAGALYFGWTWSGGRRTLAMKTWRLRLVTRNGETLEAKRALVRYAAGWIGPLVALATYSVLDRTAHAKHALWLLALGYVWALVDRDRQFLHDRIAGTRLVRDR